MIIFFFRTLICLAINYLLKAMLINFKADSDKRVDTFPLYKTQSSSS